MIICTVLDGTKYSVKDVNRLYTNLKKNATVKFKFLCYTSHKSKFNKDIIIRPITTTDKKLQWFKLDFFKKDFVEEEDIIVMDIDLDIVGNIDFLFDDYEGFVGSHRWWWRWREDKDKLPFALSGTVYKFKNGKHQYVVDTFEQDIPFWEEYFIKNGVTKGPVNGEQHFVQKTLYDFKSDFSYFPEKYIVKWHKDDYIMQMKLEKDWKKFTSNTYINDKKWHPDIRIVHYAGS
mgnify:CR=1 FL=1|tara:strand:+ start:20635 stop:21333 length:699 start_codon:yes stop_codon:yes gene_type:complete